jgi:hypothetical protein
LIFVEFFQCRLHPTRLSVVEFSNGAFGRYRFFNDQSVPAITSTVNNLDLIVMPSPGITAIYAFGIFGITVARRRTC